MSTARRNTDMLVYHGTNGDIEQIILTIGSRFKDFGQGFYVTPDKKTAERMARKKVDLFNGEPIIITYEFDESVLTSGDMNVLEFPEKATAAWIRFIDANRDRHKNVKPHSYDIVKGPIADDGVALQLGRLRSHADTAESIAKDLQDKYLDQQIYFGTPKSLNYLKKQSVCRIK